MSYSSIPPLQIDAAVHARLPESLHYVGEPTEWVKVTRPGQRLASFLEGISFASDGRIWLVDVPYGRIFSVGAGADWRVEVSYPGEPHSALRLDDGSLLIADYRDGLLRLAPGDAMPSPYLRGVNAERFRGLGDMARAPNGDIWIADPGRSSLSDPTGRLYRLPADGGAIELVLDIIPYPNGVVFSLDGSLVYVAATRANAVWRFLAKYPDPKLPMVGLHIQMSGGLGPDGMAMRGDGLLAVAQSQAGRCVVFNRLGDPVAVIHTPGGMWTTCAAFSPDGTLLYIVDAQTSAIYVAPVDQLTA